MADTDLGTAKGRIEIDSSGAVSGVGTANSATDSLIAKQGQAASTLQHTGVAMLGVGGAAIAGFGLVVKSAADFESKMNGIGAVTGATGGEMDKLRDKALQLGKDTVFSAGDAASAIEELAKAGIPVEGILNGAADAAVNLAAAGGIEIPQAAEIAANAMNSFGLSAEQLPHIVDLIAGAANASAIDVGEFAQSMAQAGTIAHLNGISFDDMAVSIAAMGNAGIKGSDAGTSLKTFLQNLQPQTEKDATLMRELGLITEESGNQFLDAGGKIKPMREVFQVLQDKLGGMTDAQKAFTLSQLFGTDAVRASAIATQLGAEGFDKLLSSINKVSASDVAEKRMSGLNGAIENLKGSFETLMIQAGTPFLHTITAVVGVFTTLFNVFLKLPAPVLTVILAITAFLGTLLAVAGVASIVLGTVAKIVLGFKQFSDALKIVKEIGLVQKAMGALNLTFLANPIFLIILALVAIGVAFYLLYTKVQGFRDFIDGAFEAVKEAAGAVIDFFSAHWGDALLVLLTGPVGIAIIIWREFGDKIIEALQVALDWLLSNWDIVLTLLTGPIGLAVLIIRRFGDDILNFFVELATNVFNTVTEWLANMINSITEWVAGVIAAIVQFVVDMITAFVQMHVDIFNATVGWLANLLASIIGWIFGVLGAIAGFVASMIGNFFGMISSIIGIVAGFLGNLVGQFFGFIFNVLGNIAGFVGNMVGQFISMGGQVISAVFGAFSQIPGIIIGFLASIPGQVVGIGVDIINGLINGIQSGASHLANLVSDLADDIISGFEDALDIFSPSKKTHKVGDFVMQGLLNGMKARRSDMLNIVTKLGTDLGNKFKDINPSALGLVGQQSAQVAAGAGVVSLPAWQARSAAKLAASGGVTGQPIEVTINNPVPEKASDSIFKSTQKLAYLGVFEEDSAA